MSTKVVVIYKFHILLSPSLFPLSHTLTIPLTFAGSFDEHGPNTSSERTSRDIDIQLHPILDSDDNAQPYTHTHLHRHTHPRTHTD